MLFLIHDDHQKIKSTKKYATLWQVLQLLQKQIVVSSASFLALS